MPARHTGGDEVRLHLVVTLAIRGS